MLIVIENPGMNTENQIDLIKRQREWLQEVLSKTGWNQTKLSKKANLSPSTLSHFLSGTRDGHALTSRTISAIEQVSGLAFDGRKMSPAFPTGGSHNDGQVLDDAFSAEHSEVLDVLLSQGAGRSAYVLTSGALRLAGYVPGDVLVVDPSIEPEDNDLVLAQATDAEDGAKRIVFRIFCQPYLVAPGMDAKDRFPLVVDRYHTKIRGVVVASVRGRNSDK